MNLKEITEKILKYWQEKNIEKKVLETDSSVKKIRNKKSYPLQFNFYDGPPFASGDPHYGHLLASTIKDLVPRYMYMRGYFVPRKWGWDCHGLPAEGYVEKLLKVKGKKEIENKIGIEKFVESCRFSVIQVNENWRWFISHLGRWVDIVRAYFTMDLDFMESVMYVFSTMYKNNLIYKSFKIQGYCPNCATPLSAYEISQGYVDRQDKAITVKFRIIGDNKRFKQITGDGKSIEKSNTLFKTSDDGFVEVVAGVVKKDNKYLVLYHPQVNFWMMPGGKVENGEDFIQALKREFNEELAVDIKVKEKKGSYKEIFKNKKYRIHYWDVQLIGEPQIQESEKHTKLAWVEVIPSDNEFGFAIKVDTVIIDDPNRIRREFIDIYILEYVFKKVSPEDLEKAPVYFLAWTTTPWTLPANMFLAVNPDIDYILVFDKSFGEYYILAKNLLGKYYRNSNEYIEIFTVKGKDLVGLTYQPLFDYYFKVSYISDKYKKEVFKVLPGNFVSTENGTGIVHIAPAFGEDDWNVVVDSKKNIGELKRKRELVINLDGKFNTEDNLFTPETANEWLFLPLNEYAEYTSLVPDYEGKQVFKANDEIIKDLKKEKLIVKIETITHSYPHCRRCDTPLIYRAIDSRFVKIGELSRSEEREKVGGDLNFKEKLLNEAKDIYFVPESVKNRFIKGIESAPDWNISRNRYWGAPLPVWESVGNKRKLGKITEYDIKKLGVSNKTIFDLKNGRIIVGCLDDLYKLSKTGSKNITKLVLQRHGETEYNVKHLADSLGKAILTRNGCIQSEKVAKEYFDIFSKIDFDKVVILHGFEGSPQNGLLKFLKQYFQSFGKKVYVPCLPNSFHPDAREQLDFVKKNCPLDTKTLVIGHSLGGLLALLIEYEIDIAGLVLIAPVTPNFNRSYFERTEWSKRGESDFESGYRYIEYCKNKLARHYIKVPYLVICGGKDKYIDFKTVKDFFKDKSSIKLLEDEKHMTNSTNFEIVWLISKFLLDEFEIIISPLPRTFETIVPFIKKLIIDDYKYLNGVIKNDFNKSLLNEIQDRYYKVVDLYQYLWRKYINDLIGILKGKKSIDDIDDKQVRNIIKELKNEGVEIISSCVFKIFSKIPLYVDWRVTDHITPSIQDKEFDCHTIEFNTNPIGNDVNGESAMDVYNRVVKAVKYWIENNFGKTVIIVSHGDPIVMVRKALRDFDRKERKYDFYPGRGEYKIHYVRKKLGNEDDVVDFVKQRFSKLLEEERQSGNDINIDFSKIKIASIKEVDLHRPYIDEVWFQINGIKFERISEILDCWFESGSMPYGQDHYPFED